MTWSELVERTLSLQHRTCCVWGCQPLASTSTPSPSEILSSGTVCMRLLQVLAYFPITWEYSWQHDIEFGCFGNNWSSSALNVVWLLWNALLRHLSRFVGCRWHGPMITLHWGCDVEKRAKVSPAPSPHNTVIFLRERGWLPYEIELYSVM